MHVGLSPWKGWLTTRIRPDPMQLGVRASPSHMPCGVVWLFPMRTVRLSKSSRSLMEPSGIASAWGQSWVMSSRAGPATVKTSGEGRNTPIGVVGPDEEEGARGWKARSVLELKSPVGGSRGARGRGAPLAGAGRLWHRRRNRMERARE